MHDVPFVDAHVHFWDLAHLRYPWLQPPFTQDGPNGSVEGIARTYLPGDYRAEAAAWTIAGAVHVEAGAHADDALAETEWLAGLAVETGMPGAIVAFADLTDPDVATLLARHAAHQRVRGIRQIVNWHADPRRSYTAADLTGTERWAAGFARLADHGLSFDLQCYPGQMPAVAAIAARHPAVPVMINHLGMPVLADTHGLDDWRRGMAALARPGAAGLPVRSPTNCRSAAATRRAPLPMACAGTSPITRARSSSTSQRTWSTSQLTSAAS